MPALVQDEWVPAGGDAATTRVAPTVHSCRRWREVMVEGVGAGLVPALVQDEWAPAGGDGATTRVAPTDHPSRALAEAIYWS